jgi:hypothetical protein
MEQEIPVLSGVASSTVAASCKIIWESLLRLWQQQPVTSRH